MSDFRCKEKEQLSRQEVAERLTDIAYALTAGGRLKLDGDADVRMPIAGPVVLKRKSRSKEGRVELEIELSWSEPT